MDFRNDRLTLKLIFGIMCVFVVLAFSMVLTTTTRAQAADTATPTETFTPTPTETSTPEATSSSGTSATPAPGATQASGASATPSPTSGATQAPSTGATPAPGATSTPSTNGSTGTVPVTGQNQAPNAAFNLAFSRARARLANVSDSNLENQYSDLLKKLRRQQSVVNNATNKFNMFSNRLGKAAASINAQDQSSLNASQRRNRNIEEIREDWAQFTRALTVARSRVFAAQAALGGHVGFDASGGLTNRQAAINTLALAEANFERGSGSVKQLRDMDFSSNTNSIGRTDRREGER